MEAPDKLYVSQLIYETWQSQTPDPDDDTQVEYIRKDLLLEWLENKVSLSYGVATDAFVEVIDKINLL